NVRHVVYDTVSEDAALDAFESRYGQRALANYDFSKAETIVSVGADFLGDWAGGGYDAAYARGRVPQNGRMSRHIQFESNFSLTGANADKRIPVKLSQQRAVLNALNAMIGGGGTTSDLPTAMLEQDESAGAQLISSCSSAVLVAGIPDGQAQAHV